MKWVIFDLDGTLADITKRREISTLPSGKMDWDEPNIPVIEACKAMKAHAPVEGLFYAPSQERGFPRLPRRGLAP